MTIKVAQTAIRDGYYIVSSGGGNNYFGTLEITYTTLDLQVAAGTIPQLEMPL